jgi:GNAT superfamily N-acetyltransferase
VTPPKRSVDRRINPVTPEQWRPVADTLAAAFCDDPVLGWLLPNSARRAGALQRLTVLERAHPRYPHYYLPFIGVTPAKHGQGIGGAILSTMLRRCDAEHLPAHLESSSPDNARFYRRHGFLTIRQMQPLGAPRIELMVRRRQR